jgi:hypothetical protein
MAVSKTQPSVGSEIPGTYHAAVVQRFREPLTIEQVPRADLAPVNESMAHVEAGRVAARVVFEP